MSENLSIVILSAGKGTRMKSSTPKVLHNILGKPMLFHIVSEAQKLSADITLIVAHQSEKVISIISEFFPNLKFIHQNQDFSGTGGALMDFQPQGKKTLILNGDMPLITSAELEKLLQINSDIVMTSAELENPTGYGRIVKNADEVLKIVEEKDCSENEKLIKSVNAGVYLVDSEFLKATLPKLSNQNSQKEYYLTDIVEIAKSEKKSVFSVSVSDRNFKGINSKLDLANAEKIFLDRIRNDLMLNGTTIHIPETVYIEPTVKFIGECEVEQNVTILGDSTIENSIIKAGSIIENSKIINSTIGVLAHIRPKSIIKNSKIGNFVEVKQSELNGVKAGHLAYLGNANIGENTNIGAGVITANYDGKNKFQTNIGKNVFVGSDSQLIAPLNIPDNCMIGAGSTVPSNSDIPEGSLALSRNPLKIIKKFFFRFYGK